MSGDYSSTDRTNEQTTDGKNSASSTASGHRISFLRQVVVAVAVAQTRSGND